ncbi:MAG: hypothetical protein EOM28_10265 [Clostridia bacterium]|nr:hypothetical protein [Clostridia bacterium]
MIFITFLSVILILFLSYWFTKYVGTRTMKSRVSRHMEIVDRLPVSQDKSVVILKVEKNYYLLSLSQGGIGLIKELENIDEQVFQDMDEDQSKKEYDFKDVFSQYFVNKKK